MRKILWLLLIPAMIYCQDAQDNPKFERYLSSGFNLLFHNGLWGGTVPAHPENESTAFDYNSYGFGVNVDYQVLKFLSLHFDINHYKRKMPLAYKGGYATSDWVWEMNDYDHRLVGPFEYDAVYSVNTTGARLGLKIYPLTGGWLRPWMGVYFGYYTWTAGIFTEDNKKSYGSTSGDLTSLSYLNFGVDFWNKSKTFGLTLFYEFGSPVAKNYKIEECIVDEWTFTDYGEGFHLFGYNRVGISINFTTMKNTK